MRWRSSILYIPPTKFALLLPLLTSPLRSFLWQADSRQWPLTLCLLSRGKVAVYVCVPGCEYVQCILYAWVCERLCVWNASRENIQPKIKPRLSAFIVSVYFCATIFCACVRVSLCKCSVLSLRRWSLLWMVTNGTEGEEGRSWVLHVETYQVFNADINSGIK